MHKKLPRFFLFLIFFMIQIKAMQPIENQPKVRVVRFADEQMTFHGLMHNFNVIAPHIKLQSKYGSQEPLTPEDINFLWTTKKENDTARAEHWQAIPESDRTRKQAARDAHKEKILKRYQLQPKKKKMPEFDTKKNKVNQACMLLTGVISVGIVAMIITAQLQNQNGHKK